MLNFMVKASGLGENSGISCWVTVRYEWRLKFNQESHNSFPSLTWRGTWKRKGWSKIGKYSGRHWYAGRRFLRKSCCLIPRRKGDPHYSRRRCLVQKHDGNSHSSNAICPFEVGLLYWPRWCRCLEAYDHYPLQRIFRAKAIWGNRQKEVCRTLRPGEATCARRESSWVQGWGGLGPALRVPGSANAERGISKNQRHQVFWRSHGDSDPIGIVTVFEEGSADRRRFGSWRSSAVFLERLSKGGVAYFAGSTLLFRCACYYL